MSEKIAITETKDIFFEGLWYNEEECNLIYVNDFWIYVPKELV